MPRGGYQKPSNPAAVSGPGKFSRRTDGGQKVVEPDIDNPDLQYGDRSMLEDAQRRTPLKGSQGARVASGAERRPQGSALDGKLPPWLTTTPDPHPDEPTTAGLASGPGPGPEVLDAATPPEDIREVVLQWMVQQYGNPDVARMLNDMRNEREQRVNVPTPSAPMTDPLSALAQEPLPAAAGGAEESTLPGGDLGAES